MDKGNELINYESEDEFLNSLINTHLGKGQEDDSAGIVEYALGPVENLKALNEAPLRARDTPSLVEYLTPEVLENLPQDILFEITSGTYTSDLIKRSLIEAQQYWAEMEANQLPVLREEVQAVLVAINKMHDYDIVANDSESYANEFNRMRPEIMARLASSGGVILRVLESYVRGEIDGSQARKWLVSDPRVSDEKSIEPSNTALGQFLLTLELLNRFIDFKTFVAEIGGIDSKAKVAQLQAILYPEIIQALPETEELSEIAEEPTVEVPYIEPLPIEKPEHHAEAMREKPPLKISYKDIMAVLESDYFDVQIIDYLVNKADAIANDLENNREYVHDFVNLDTLKAEFRPLADIVQQLEHADESSRKVFSQVLRETLYKYLEIFDKETDKIFSVEEIQVDSAHPEYRKLYKPALFGKKLRNAWRIVRNKPGIPKKLVREEDETAPGKYIQTQQPKEEDLEDFSMYSPTTQRIAGLAREFLYTREGREAIFGVRDALNAPTIRVAQEKIDKVKKYLDVWEERLGLRNKEGMSADIGLTFDILVAIATRADFLNWNTEERQKLFGFVSDRELDIITPNIKLVEELEHWQRIVDKTVSPDIHLEQGAVILMSEFARLYNEFASVGATVPEMRSMFTRLLRVVRKRNATNGNS